MSESQENSNKERLDQAEESKEGEAGVAEEDLAVAGMRTASEEAKIAAAMEGIKTLSAQGLADLTKRLEDLPPEQRKPFLESAARTLPAKDQRELGATLSAPTQPVTDLIWKVIVWAFAIVLVLAVATICAAVLLRPGSDVQTLLTVVTTVIGTLSGFISGRASAGGTAS
jgi:hypothetical protein